MVDIGNLTGQQIKELRLTEEEIKELENIRSMPVAFDEDCPETTPEMAIRFKRVNPPRKGIVGSPA